jgi:hypothetical protein
VALLGLRAFQNVDRLAVRRVADQS